jgi:hypothetical protein
VESFVPRLPALLKPSVSVLILATGMGSSVRDLTCLGRRTGLSLLAMNGTSLL